MPMPKPMHIVQLFILNICAWSYCGRAVCERHKDRCIPTMPAASHPSLPSTFFLFTQIHTHNCFHFLCSPLPSPSMPMERCRHIIFKPFFLFLLFIFRLTFIRQFRLPIANIVVVVVVVATTNDAPKWEIEIPNKSSELSLVVHSLLFFFLFIHIAARPALSNQNIWGVHFSGLIIFDFSSFAIRCLHWNSLR